VLVQLVASTDHLRTWIDLYSLVDHFTIVPTFVGIYYNTNWIGQHIHITLGDYSLFGASLFFVLTHFWATVTSRDRPALAPRTPAGVGAG